MPLEQEPLFFKPISIYGVFSFWFQKKDIIILTKHFQNQQNKKQPLQWTGGCSKIGLR